MTDVQHYLQNLTAIDWIGFAGVLMMLIAFFLNIFDKIDNDHPAYICLNALGGGFAASSAYITHAYPFVLMEGTWCLASVWALIIYFKRDFKGFR